MDTRALGWLGGAAGAAALLYWQLIIAEGAYLGPQAVRFVYSLGAPYYDAVRAAGQAAADAALLPPLLAALEGRPRPAVLDVATGTGRLPHLLAAQPGSTGLLVALDLTPPMLAAARRKERADAQAIAWTLSEASRLPWRDSCFDLVSCLEALEYFPRPRQALAEMARVLRPGGALVISKWPDSWARLLPARAFTSAALQRALAHLGFVDLRFRPWQPGHYELVLARKV
jgi:ubiquinone/menaquinone biosynthesis C-methylase UbiE